MPLEAVVRPRLDGDPDTLGLAPLAVLHRLGHGVAGVTLQLTVSQGTAFPKIQDDFSMLDFSDVIFLM